MNASHFDVTVFDHYNLSQIIQYQVTVSQNAFYNPPLFFPAYTEAVLKTALIHGRYNCINSSNTNSRSS